MPDLQIHTDRRREDSLLCGGESLLPALLVSDSGNRARDFGWSDQAVRWTRTGLASGA